MLVAEVEDSFFFYIIKGMLVGLLSFILRGRGGDEQTCEMNNCIGHG